MSDARAKRPTRDVARGDAVVEEAARESFGAPAGSQALPGEPETAKLPPAGDTPALPAPPSAETAVTSGDEAWAVFAEAQTALARACGEVAIEVGTIARSGFAAGTDAALALLGARTIAEAVEINAGLARRNADAMVEGSAKLSEIGLRALTAASRPILAGLSANWAQPPSGQLHDRSPR